MLTPEQIAGLQVAASRITDPINDYLLRDIARRIRDAGELTSTAAYELYRSQLLGADLRKVKQDLARLLKTTQADAEALLEQAAEFGYDLDVKRLPGLVPFSENSEVQQIVSVAVKLAGEELQNMTRTEAIMMYGPDGQMRALD